MSNQMIKKPMTRVEMNMLLVRLMDARAQLAHTQKHYDDLYHQFLNEVQQHYPIESSIFKS